MTEKRTITIRADDDMGILATIARTKLNDDGSVIRHTLRYEISPELMGKIATLIDAEAIKRMPSQGE